MSRNKSEGPVDRTSAQSFPASDPPGWTGTTAGGLSPVDRAGAGAGGSPFIARLARERLNGRIARHWWAVALKGVAAIVLALLALSWPGITLLTLVLVFAVYCLADALFSAVLAVRGARHGGHWGWLALNAALGLAAGGIALFYPGLTLIAFALLLAAWGIVTGAVTIAAAFQLRHDHGRWWMAAGGLALVLLGILLAIAPPIAFFTLVWMVALGTLLSGTSLLALALRLRARSRGHDRAERGPGSAAFAQGG